MKGDGGAVGLTQNPEALQRWMVSGPEMTSLIEEFQASMEKTAKESDLHHEQTRSTQMTFLSQVKALSNVIEEMETHSFIHSSNDLLALDNRDLADPAVIKGKEVTGRVL